MDGGGVSPESGIEHGSLALGTAVDGGEQERKRKGVQYSEVGGDLRK